MDSFNFDEYLALEAEFTAMQRKAEVVIFSIEDDKLQKAKG